MIPKPPKRVRDPGFLAWVKTQTCFAGNLDRGSCSPVVEAAHTGKRAMSRKADDSTAIPLCTYHHRALHAMSGPFRRWDRAIRRAFEAAGRLHTQLAYGKRPRCDEVEW